MADRVLSLEEITAIEAEYAEKPSKPSLGYAATALFLRWKVGERDQETAIRLMFMRWYACAEPAFLTRLNDDELPTIEQLISDLGGEASLWPEALFLLGFWAGLFPWCLGNESHWTSNTQKLAKRAADLAPGCHIFRNWSFFFHVAPNVDIETQQIKHEIEHSYKDRGALGEYMTHMLVSRLGDLK